MAAVGCVPGGTRRNFDSARAEWDPELSEAERLVATDAQTSGGLLLAVAPERLDGLLAGLGAAGTPARAVIGEILPGPDPVRVARGPSER
jgi:selenide,water dikinase